MGTRAGQPIWQRLFRFLLQASRDGRTFSPLQLGPPGFPCPTELQYFGDAFPSPRTYLSSHLLRPGSSEIKAEGGKRLKCQFCILQPKRQRPSSEPDNGLSALPLTHGGTHSVQAAGWPRADAESAGRVHFTSQIFAPLHRRPFLQWRGRR